MNFAAFTIEATVTTGFEKILKEECKEKLNVDCEIEKGRVFFEIAPDKVSKVLSLRGADNIYIIIEKVENMEFPDSKENLKSFFTKFCLQIKWEEALEAWRNAVNFPFSGKNMTYKLRANKENQVENDQLELNQPTFRVTCNRVGDGHSFSSQEAAAIFGGTICDLLEWKPKMKNPDVHVYFDIKNNQANVSLPLTLESLHKRNLVDFGPTSLRATIAHNMLRVCKIEPGDIVCDPMCGGGSIPLEGAINWPNSHHICGDNHEKAYQRTEKNYQHNNEIRTNSNQLKLDIFRWDVTKLPLKENSVDVFVTDLPFGKRLGSKVENVKLYPAILQEMGRVSKSDKGRAVLLTKDRYSMIQALSKCKHLWYCAKSFPINLGGLMPNIYILFRSKEAAKCFKPTSKP